MPKKKLPDDEAAKQDTVELATESEVPQGVRLKREFDESAWNPKTTLGRKVKAGEVKDIDKILAKGEKILEPEIIDKLFPKLESDLITVGQSKGKFGGGKKSIWRQTQKKTKEGNKPNFATVAVIGNKNGYIGLGQGKSRETVPAREKAMRRAKLNLIRISRGCGSWECSCAEPHSIPYNIKGKCGSVKINLIPAPKGTGLCVEKECRKLLSLAGITDVYSKTFGHTKTKLNLIRACFEALKNLTNIKVHKDYINKAGLVEGKLK